MARVVFLLAFAIVLQAALAQVSMLLAGDAQRINGLIQLTNGTFATGAAWYPTKFTTAIGASYANDGFDASFYISSYMGSNPVADGIAFVMHTINNFTALGPYGKDMAIPVPTPGTNQVVNGFRWDWFAAFQANGVVWMELFNDTTLETNSFNTSTLDNTLHFVAVTYQQSTQTVGVLIDGAQSIVFNLNLYPDPTVSNNVIVGLTSGTGSFWSYYSTDDRFTITSKTFPVMKLYGQACSTDNPNGQRSIKVVQYDNGMVGAAYLPQQFKIASGGQRIADGYTVTFQFRAYRQLGEEKLADGFAFVVFNGSTPAVGFNGGNGGGGMALPASGMYGLKFDWWNDITGNVSLKRIDNTVIQALPLSIEPNQNYITCTIAYIDSKQQVTVTLNNAGVITNTVVTGISLFPADLTVENVWVGFNAATGGRRMTVEVLEPSVQYTLAGPVPNPPAPTPAPSSSKSSNKKNVGIGVGVAVGGVALIAIIAAVVFFAKKKGFSFPTPSRKGGFSREDALGQTDANLNKL